jgi:hypothetical protein
VPVGDVLGIEACEAVVATEKRPVQTFDRTDCTVVTLPRKRCDANLDAPIESGIRLNRPENAGNGVGKGAVEKILKLRMAKDGKQAVDVVALAASPSHGSLEPHRLIAAGTLLAGRRRMASPASLPR